MFGRKSRRIKELEADKAGLLANVQRAKTNMQRLREVMGLLDAQNIYDEVQRLVDANAALQHELDTAKHDRDLLLANLALEQIKVEKLKGKKKKVTKRKK